MFYFAQECETTSHRLNIPDSTLTVFSSH